MDGYIAKPLRPSELFAAIAELVPDTVAPSDAGAAAAASAETIDWDESLCAVGGDRRILETLAQTAIEELPRLLAAIGDAIQRGDAAALRLAAHTLKGSLRCFGNTRAHDDAARLEQMARENDFAEGRPVLSVLEEEIAALLQSLRRHVPGGGDRPPDTPDSSNGG